MHSKLSLAGEDTIAVVSPPELTKKVVESLCEGGTTEAISLNDTNVCVIDCFSATADRNDDLFGQPHEAQCDNLECTLVKTITLQ